MRFSLNNETLMDSGREGNRYVKSWNDTYCKMLNIADVITNKYYKAFHFLENKDDMPGIGDVVVLFMEDKDCYSMFNYIPRVDSFVSLDTGVLTKRTELIKKGFVKWKYHSILHTNLRKSIMDILREKSKREG